MDKVDKEEQDITNIITFPLKSDNFGLQIWDSENEHIVDIRGWGRLSVDLGEEEAKKAQRTIQKFIVDACNKYANELKDN